MRPVLQSRAGYIDEHTVLEIQQPSIYLLNVAQREINRASFEISVSFTPAFNHA